MLKKYSILISFFFGFSTAVHAVPFEPTFSDYSFPGSQFNVDAAANAFFATNYGLSIENAYLYVDSRDAFDGIGVANGTTPLSGTQTGVINFLDTTDFVSIDVATLAIATFSAFDVAGNLVDSFVTGSGTVNTTFLFTGLISSLAWTGAAGRAGVSGLRYDYDGTTGGGNTDLDPKSVPEASSIMLLGLGLVGLMFSRRKKSA